jgi:hypothetical protein
MYKTLKSLLTVTCFATSFSAQSMEMDLSDLMAAQGGGGDQKSLVDIFTGTAPNGDIVFTQNVEYSVIHKRTGQSPIMFGFMVTHTEDPELKKKQFKLPKKATFSATRPTLMIDESTEEVIGRFFEAFAEVNGVSLTSTASRELYMSTAIVSMLNKDKTFRLNCMEALALAKIEHNETPAKVYSNVLGSLGTSYDKHQKLMEVLNTCQTSFQMAFDMPNGTSILTVAIGPTQGEFPEAIKLPLTFDDYTTEIVTFIDSMLNHAWNTQMTAIDRKSASRAYGQ